MAKNITLMGADYPDVPAVQLPQTGGGTATFYDIEVVSTGSKTLSGNGNISHTFQEKVLVLAAYSTSSDIVCNAYPSFNADASGSKTWWIHCRNANSAGSVASGSITCYLIYIRME